MNKYKLMILLVSGLQGRLIAGDFVFVQKDSPLQVVGVTSTLKDSYSRVIAVNVSAKTIQQAQFGWTVTTRTGNTKAVIAFGYGPHLDFKLPPFEVSEAGAQGASVNLLMDKMKEVGAKQSEVRLGVVYVKFEDGSEWWYPLEGNKQFIEVSDPGLVEKVGPKVQEYRQRNGLVGSSRACSPNLKAANDDPKNASFGRDALAWITNLLSVRTVQAQNDLVFVCDPAPRLCINNYDSCTSYFCFPPYYCNYQRCCLLNLQTGQKTCDP